jgi:poly-gamma-glutamate synthesis protein (capsule biosynthesis protein)
MTEPLTIVAVGDVIVNRPEPESIFKYTRDIIQNADLSVCQLATSYSDKGSMGSSGPRGAMAHDLRNYRALPAAGFKVVSMARNHAMDWGTDQPETPAEISTITRRSSSKLSVHEDSYG